jgi:outer membrane protein assembly factor BamB
MPRPRRPNIFVAALIAAAICSVTGSRAATMPAPGHWPQWRGPMRDAVSTETGLLQRWPAAGPTKLWTATGLGLGYSSVAITGGRIYTMGDLRGGQHVIALEEQTGKPVWSTRIAGGYQGDFDGPRGTPTVDGALLYAIAADGTLVCLDTATGRERWRKHLERDFGGEMMSSWQWAESPLVDGDLVVVTPGGARAAMVALNKTTGAEVWRATIPRLGSRGLDGAGYSSIVISTGGGVRQYVQLMGRGVVGIRASDGRYLWGNNSVANGTANIPTPVVKGNYVFASSGYTTGSVLVELTPAGNGLVTATQKYFLDGGEFQNHHGGMVVVGDYLYAGHGHNNGLPTCIELATGRRMWAQVRSSVGAGSASVVAADGRLYFHYQNGTMVLVEANPAAYREAGAFRIPNPAEYSWSHPVVTGGRLYIREQDALHVYDVTRQ